MLYCIHSNGRVACLDRPSPLSPCEAAIECRERAAVVHGTWHMVHDYLVQVRPRSTKRSLLCMQTPGVVLICPLERASRCIRTGACVVVRHRTFGIVGAARMMKLLGVGVLLMAVRAGAFGVMLQATSFRRVARPASSQAFTTSAVTARGGRCVAYLAQ